MSDFPGPEKPLDFKSLVQAEMGDHSVTAAYCVQSRRKVRARHRVIVMLHETGWKNKDIARALGYTEARVSTVLNSHHPELVELRTNFASQVADNIKDIHSRIALYAPEMLDRLVDHARQNESIEQSRLAARDILHMAGFTPIKKHFVMEAKIPAEELRRVVGKIQEANEVVLNRTEWEVKEIKSA